MVVDSGLLYRVYAADSIVGYGVGTSVLALFARVSGGIFSEASRNAAQIAATQTSTNDDHTDTTTTIQQQQQRGENSSNNLNKPAFIASRVGELVTGISGMGADTFDTLAGSIIAVVILAEGDTVKVALPFWIAASGILASAVAFFFVKPRNHATRDASHKDLVWTFYEGVLVASVFVVLLSAVIVVPFFDN